MKGTRRHWYAIKAPNGRQGSERMDLYSWIQIEPGISTAQLQAKWGRPSAARHRLDNLENKGYVRSEIEPSTKDKT